MYVNNKLLVGKNDDFEAYLLPKMANRHGIITGASGSGKTVTLKVLAESFSNAGIPVFLVDVKGDLAGMSLPGEMNENIAKRVEKLKLESFEVKSFPTNYFDVYGKNGIPIRTTVKDLGPRLLSRMLDLSDAQEGVLTVAFKIAEDINKELIDLNDLRNHLVEVADKRKEYSLTYGNITTQSVGSIQRNILALQEDGGDDFFGKPSFNIKDFIHFDENNGYGFINILDAVTLFRKPNLYVSFLLWLLNTIYDTMTEVGDLNKPKLIFFFDEAHLLFNEMPEGIIKSVIQIVKLIRSKGVGIYFISQTPSDIPDEILSQLGNRIQHVLRSYTRNDEKAVKAAANSFRANPNFNTEEVIKTLATGEALVSFQNEIGEPTITEKVTILPPQSKMGTIDDLTRQDFIKKSHLYSNYEKREEIVKPVEEKKEVLFEHTKEVQEEKTMLDIDTQPRIKLQTQKEEVEVKQQPASETKVKKQVGRPKKSATEKFTDRVISTTGNGVGKLIVKGLKNLFK
ncbi:MAG: DUF853 family protein [Bacilli bacterium]|nr:DUF853 family protein [Bacilli bacterium]